MPATRGAAMTDWDRVRALWPDHLGLARGKYLPARLAHKGTSHCVTVFGLGYDRSMAPAPGAYLLDGLPDTQISFDTADIRQGWDDDATGVVIGDLSMHGEALPESSRGALRRAVTDWETLGYTPKVGIELEAYVFSGGLEDPRPYETPRSMVYGTGVGSDPAGVVTKLVRRAEASGIAMESVNAEYDEGQFELTLEYGDAMWAADNAFLFRLLARETVLTATDAAGQPLGLDLTFLGKPFPGISGTGVHVNFSLVDAQGDNAMSDTGGAHGMSDLARGCMAGLIDHHLGMTALAAPTVNAYRRLRPGELNGYWANWGVEHRCAGNRVPRGAGPHMRIESRIGDGAANVHTLIAAVLQAARLGMVGGLDCPEPMTTDGFDDVNTDVHCAHSLSEALDEMEADEALCEAVGKELCDNFVFNKRAEWDRYIAGAGDEAVDDWDAIGGTEPLLEWELKQYLPYH
ncbi:MAG: glutamine synthetase [Acidimicrobiaceae bacterium]|nr:glutamine synthetase [Acidimicrobiaceae bacterium]